MAETTKALYLDFSVCKNLNIDRNIFIIHNIQCINLKPEILPFTAVVKQIEF